MVFIGAMILTIVFNMINRGVGSLQKTTEAISVQRGMRNVVENMARDVAGALLIEEPNGSHTTPHNKVVVYRYGLELAQQRLTTNDSPSAPEIPQSAYPFGNLATDSVNRLTVLRIEYEHDPTEKVVKRRFVPGELSAVAAAAESPRLVSRYDFSPIGTPVESNMASNVTTFEVVAAGYDPYNLDLRTGRGRVLDTASLPARPVGPILTPGGPGPGPKTDQTCLIVLRVGGSFERPNPTRRTDGSMEIVTKMWSYPKLYDHVYAPYFSSVDHDLRY